VLELLHVKIAIIVPPDFSKKLARKEKAKVQVLIDGTDPNVARTALATAQLVARAYGGRLQAELTPAALAGSMPGGLEAETRVLYNPEMKSLVFNIPGLIGLIMQNVTAMLTAFAMVREKERGTMEQLVVTPIRPGELILGKLIPYVGIGLFSFTLVLLVGINWFGVPVQGSLTLLFLLSLLFLVTTLAIGLLISTLAQTQLQAMQLTFLLILPSILLSGFIFPRETMPWVIQGIGGLFPLTYFLIILRGIFLKGLSIAYLWQETLILSAFALLLCIMAMARFRKTVD